MGVNQASRELYNILCAVANGEAMTVTRSVEDCEGRKAWQKLHLKHKPGTMARAIRRVAEVACPASAKTSGQIEGAMQRWEPRMTQMTKPLKNSMQIAIMTSSLPAVMQDFVCQNVDNKTKFEDTVEKVKVLVGHRVAMATDRTPMDIGEEGWSSDAHSTEEAATDAVRACGTGSEIVPPWPRIRARRATAGRRVSARATAIASERQPPPPPAKEGKGWSEGERQGRV